MQKGFYFSIEIVIAFIFLALLFSQSIDSGDFSLDEVLLLQKQNDLLKIWAFQQETSMSTLISDFQFVFPGGKKAVIFINENKHEVSGSGSKAISGSISFFDRLGTKTKIKLIIFA